MDANLIKLIFEAGAVDRELSERLVTAVVSYGKERYIEGWNEASKVVAKEAQLACAREGINMKITFQNS